MGEMLVLRFIHVVGAVLWVGSVFFFAVFLEPTLRKAGPEGGRMMMRLGASKYPQVISIIGILTLLTGLRLYMRAASMSPDWMRTGTGMLFGIGGAAAILAFLLGFFISRPSAGRMTKLAGEIQAGGGAPTDAQSAELTRLRGRLVGAVRMVLALLLIAAAMMSIARYVA